MRRIQHAARVGQTDDSAAAWRANLHGCRSGALSNVWRHGEAAAALQLAALAESTQDTVYLSERRGLEAICSSRALGDYPIKALTLDVGIRRPLGIGAGGLAILCALPAAEADEIIEAHAQRYPKLSTLTAYRVRAAVHNAARAVLPSWMARSIPARPPWARPFQPTHPSPPSARPPCLRA